MEPKYTLVSADTTFGVCETVNNLMKRGWIPIGGVSVSLDMSRKEGYDQRPVAMYVQAMVMNMPSVPAGRYIRPSSDGP